jgi:hypothetical protein
MTLSYNKRAAAAMTSTTFSEAIDR